jgi:tetratricopeptide (TPR) repeat protein
MSEQSRPPFTDPRQNPRFWEAFRALEQAVQAQRLGRNTEADRLYATLIKNNPDYFDALNLYGLFNYHQGKYQAAFDLLRRATAIHPRSVSTLNNLGIVLCHLKRPKDALETFERAHALDPTDPNTLNNRGNALLDLNQPEAALVSFDAATKLQPRFVNAYINRGRALSRLGRHEDALANYNQALVFAPLDAAIHYNRGGIQYKLHRWEEALTSFDKAIALNPHYIEALTARGHLLMRLGRHAEAAQMFNDLFKVGGAHSIDALVALSSLPSHVKIDLPEIDKMIGAGYGDEAQSNKVLFVRAAALDKLDRHAEAWECLTLANRRIFETCQADVNAETERLRATLDRLRNTPVTTTTGSIERNYVTSLFVLGPSRSGKTVLERLVSVLPGVRRGYESLCAVDDAIRRTLEANALPANTMFEDIPETLHGFCREAYADQDIRQDRSTSIVTNTLPIRIYTADLMVGVFPNVRFLCVKRNIEDTILRMYQRTYDTGNGYAYDLKTARNYVVCYHQAIDLLCEKFPQLVRTVWYEEMVTDPAGTLRAVAEFLGTPVPDGPLPPLTDDRGCAAPYSSFMATELER